MDSLKYEAAFIGDSQTDLRSSYGVMATDMWSNILCQMLNAAGCSIQPRVFGTSGNTTAQMLARSDVMFLYGLPSIAFIYGGVNDPGNSINAAGTQANIQALCKSLKYGACGRGEGLGGGVSVAGEVNLPAGGRPGQRYVVMADTSANGGASKNHPNQHDTITGVGGGVQTVWEYRNKQGGEAGWGRVAISTTPAFTQGVSKIIVLSTNYLNFTSGGDNYNVTAQSGTQNSTNAGVRVAVKAAAIAENVLYCDLYAFQSMLIYGGVFEGQPVSSETNQSSASWHVGNTDQHHNAYGHETVARAVFSTIYSQNGWIQNLK